MAAMSPAIRVPTVPPPARALAHATAEASREMTTMSSPRNIAERDLAAKRERKPAIPRPSGLKLKSPTIEASPPVDRATPPPGRGPLNPEPAPIPRVPPI